MRNTVVPAIIAGTLVVLLAGCAPSDPAASAAVEPQATTPSAPVGSTDAEACEQLTVPLSLLFNAQVAPEGAMSLDTAGGLYFTAAWDLRRIDELLDESDLAAPVTRLAEAAGAVSSRMDASDDPAAWADRLAEIGTATEEITAVCAEADPDAATLGWYGG